MVAGVGRMVELVRPGPAAGKRALCSDRRRSSVTAASVDAKAFESACALGWAACGRVAGAEH